MSQPEHQRRRSGPRLVTAKPKAAKTLSRADSKSRSKKIAAKKSVERKAIKETIAAAVTEERAGQAFGLTGKRLKEILSDIRSLAIDRYNRGDQISAALSAGVDALIEALHAAAPAEFRDELCLVAIGGYGRGELAPYSDVDLLFLYRPEFEDQLGPALNFFLYPLWDSNLKLGYAAHTEKSACAYCKDDLIARTAYLDARYLCGPEDIFDKFLNSFDKLRRRTKTQFVSAKLEEQNKRQEKSFETRYLVEPDIKEGKGGLRDLQTIHWIYKYVYGEPIGESRAIDKIMDVNERRALKKAERFLQSVRVHLHDLRGRADEKLTFDIQPEIAARLGYHHRSHMTAAERLMKHYFVNTVAVGRLTRILCARLEEERAKRLPHMPKLLPREMQKDEVAGKPNLRIRNGRLDFESAAKARRRPVDLFRLFRAFSKQTKIDFHPNALAIVSEEVPKITSDIRSDPVVAKVFAATLTDSVAPVRVLRIMSETGLLGKYIPAYGAIVGRIDYGLYRRFTLDEHVLRCVGLLNDIRTGSLKKEHPVSTRILQKSEKPLVFYLALLLHEAAWSLKNRSVEDAERLVVRIGKRLGLDDHDASLAGWGAARHLSMVRTAERRDLSDARAISNFAQRVGAEERLDLMLVLSVCHLRMVGVQSWDNTVRRQLSALHRSARVWFKGGEDAVAAHINKQALETQAQVKERIADWTEQDKEKFIARLSTSAFRSVGADIIARFANLVRAADKDKAPCAVQVSPRDGELEAIIYTQDRAGLLADLAGVIAANGLSVRAVYALTTKDGKAIDIFAIQSSDGYPIDDGSQAQRVHQALLDIAAVAPTKAPVIERRLGDRRSIFHVDPEVRIENDASAAATVIETEGLDRPGLMYELASALSECGLTIDSAHIATYGERAVDAFYVHPAEGKKVTDKKLLAQIKKRLNKVLSAGSSA